MSYYQLLSVSIQSLPLHSKDSVLRRYTFKDTGAINESYQEARFPE